MMKAIMLSIKSEWCSLIKNGMKTVEVRKSRPKIETPFKVYIYCTHGCSFLVGGKHPLSGNGMVVGEFVCDRITCYPYNSDGCGIKDEIELCWDSAMSSNELYQYLQGLKPYAWHISKLKIYDVPIELSEFRPANCWKKQCFSCTLKRPPQSWQYVEEREDNANT